MSSNEKQDESTSGNQEDDVASSEKQEDESGGEGQEIRKRQRQETASPRPSYSPTASPSKHSTFEDLLATAGLMENMTLAHEIVMDGNFKISPIKLPFDSVERKVHDMMHNAFWDVLRSDLEEDPPSYDHAIKLFSEIKSIMISFLLPSNQRFRSEIEEALDLYLIQQQAEHGALDVKHYANLVLGIMGKLCAPIRDDEIKKLYEIEDIVDLYREIFQVLDLMKLDMANFTIQSVRPHLQQHSIEYERDKFQQFLKVQQDGLACTKKWLDEIKQELESSRESSVSEAQAASSEVDGASAASSISPLLLLNHAYVKLLFWDPVNVHKFPETVLMDQSRLTDIGNQVKKACLIASLLLTTYTHVGPAISGIQGLPSRLKYVISVIIADSNDMKGIMPNIAEQICAEIAKCLSDHGFKEMDSSNMDALKSQLNQLSDENNTVRKLLDKRARSFLLSVLSMQPKTDKTSKIPPGLSTVQRQMTQLAEMFTKVATHNRAVYGPFYSDIIGTLLNLPR